MKYVPFISAFILSFAITYCGYSHGAEASPTALRYRADLTREAHFVFGLNAPVQVLAAQIEQESGWRPGITAWDNGRGLAQFMDPTAEWAAKKYDLGPPDPYNPKWAIRAMTRLDGHNLARVRGDTPCDKWGAGLIAYNIGLGRVLKAQSISGEPGRWWEATERINAGQSQQNFEVSRLYPRRIMFQRAQKYEGWGTPIECGGRK